MKYSFSDFKEIIESEFTARVSQKDRNRIAKAVYKFYKKYKFIDVVSALDGCIQFKDTDLDEYLEENKSIFT